MKSFITLCLFLCSLPLFVQGQTVTLSGTITTEEGETLPFATIYVSELGTGVTSNADGFYSLNVAPGKYEVTYQYLGYESKTFSMTISADTKKDVTLLTQAITLREVTVTDKREDPAYTIMRKAITKAKYHTMQVAEYTKKVYVKGGGRIKDAPFFLRKMLAKEGIDSSTVFLSESISEVHYTYPGQYDEKVLHFRMVGTDSANVNAMNYINASFYSPEIGGAISPLSPKAFAYYKFKYEGSFFDRGVEVNKIKVKPRVNGDDVFFGYIYIIENLWAIHSLDLALYKMGFKIDVDQMYAPVQEGVWMPVSHKYEGTGSVWGFDFEANYLATASDYKITLNPDLQDAQLTLVDEKVEKELAKIVEKENTLEKELDKQNPEMAKLMKGEQKMTRKQLKKVLKEYEKQMEEEKEEPEVSYESTYKVDSLAANADSTFWASVRPVPLSKMEKTGYQKMDSISVAEEKKEASGSSRAKKKKSGFQPGDLIFGESYKVGKKGNLKFGSALMNIQYNTVEGYNTILPISYRHNRRGLKNWSITNTSRYGFANERFSNKLDFEYNWRKKDEPRETTGGKFYLGGGRFINQINPENPISPTLNTISTLLFEQNFMKIYEKDYAEIGLQTQLSDKLRLNVDVQFAERRPLFNTADTLKWVDRSSRNYSINNPYNVEIGDTSFEEHQAFTGHVGFSWLPSLRFRKYNGRKIVIENSSPLLRFDYHFGLKDIAGSDVDFGRVEAGFKHNWKIGARGRVHANLYAGMFTHSNSKFLMDYKHFPGNLTLFQSINPAGSFRLLDYYQYSTDEEYTGGHLNYQFRRFLLTQIFEVRMLAVRENIIFNYMKTPNSPFYTELGYSLDNIFRLFRVEAVANFLDGEYNDWGIRIGISTNLGNAIRIERE